MSKNEKCFLNILRRWKFSENKKIVLICPKTIYKSLKLLLHISFPFTSGIADCVLAVGFEKMEKGSLGSKWFDRTNPIDQHVQSMSDTYGIDAKPMAPQMFGNAGKEQ